MNRRGLNLSRLNHRRLLAFLSLVFLFAALPVFLARAQAEPQISPDGPSLPDDIMPGAPQTAAPQDPNLVGPSAGYEVAPILFVPADVTPHPVGLAYVDRHMSNVRHWYAEQLMGWTFTLRPAILVVGEQPRTFYFGDCYPPNSSGNCSWGHATWDRVFAELDSRGYTIPPGLIQGVFFQGEGMSTALGGGRRFLVGFQPDTVFPDCVYSGCAHNVSLGGAAHELGHALGLPHPDGDPGWGDSLMGTGFYMFPHSIFLNSTTYPEFDNLRKSPFINTLTPLINPGFESCLAGWTAEAGTPRCTKDVWASGFRSLALDGPGDNRLSQVVAPVFADEDYDFTGWYRVDALPPGGSFQIELEMVVQGTKVETRTLLAVEEPTAGWVRFGRIIEPASDTDTVLVRLITEGADVSVNVDDLRFQMAEIPPMPLIAGGYDGDAARSRWPLLRWSPVAGATSFDVQIAADPAFETILAEGNTAEYTFRSPVELPFDVYVYWRARSVAAAGASDWSPGWAMIPRRVADFINDEFESETLGPAWSILREDAGRWHLGGLANRGRRSYLTIDAQKGDLATADNARNVFRRAAPPGDFTVDTLMSIYVPIYANYQQGALLIFEDDDNYVKLAQIYRDGFLVELEVERDGEIVQRDSAVVVDETRLKIERRGDTYTAWYSTNGVDFRPLGQPETADWPDVDVALSAFGAPVEFPAPTFGFHWLRFAEPCRDVAVAVEPEGAGTVSLDGVTCADGRWRATSPLRLSAEPAAGFRFDHWSGGPGGSANPLALVVGDDLALTAHFAAIPPPVNQPPVAADDAYQVMAGATLEVAAAEGVLANDEDAEGDALSAALASGPAHGLLALNADGSFSYTPATGFAGQDGFTYRASDGLNESAAAAVVITVEAPPPPPPPPPVVFWGFVPVVVGE